MFTYSIPTNIQAGDARFHSGKLKAVGTITTETETYYVVFSVEDSTCMFYDPDTQKLVPLSSTSWYLSFTAAATGLGLTGLLHFDMGFATKFGEYVAKQIVGDQTVEITKAAFNKGTMAALNTTLNFEDPRLEQYLTDLKEFEQDRMGIPANFSRDDVRNIISSRDYPKHLQKWIQNPSITPSDECYIYIHDLSIFSPSVQEAINTAEGLTFNVESGELWKCNMLQKQLKALVTTGGAITKAFSGNFSVFQGTFDKIERKLNTLTSAGSDVMINTLVKEFDHTVHTISPPDHTDQYLMGHVNEFGHFQYKSDDNTDLTYTLEDLVGEQNETETDEEYMQRLLSNNGTEVEQHKLYIEVETDTLENAMNQTYAGTTYDTVAQLAGIMVGKTNVDEQFGVYDFFSMWNVADAIDTCWSNEGLNAMNDAAGDASQKILNNALTTQATWETIRSYFMDPAYVNTMQFGSVMQGFVLWVSDLTQKEARGGAVASIVDSVLSWVTGTTSAQQNILNQRDMKALLNIRQKLISLYYPFSKGSSDYDRPEGLLHGVCTSMKRTVEAMANNAADHWVKQRSNKVARIYASVVQEELYNSTASKFKTVAEMVITSTTGLTIRQLFEARLCSYRLFYEDAVLNPDCATLSKKLTSLATTFAGMNTVIYSGRLAHLSKYFTTTSAFNDHA